MVLLEVDGEVVSKVVVAGVVVVVLVVGGKLTGITSFMAVKPMWFTSPYLTRTGTPSAPMKP